MLKRKKKGKTRLTSVWISNETDSGMSKAKSMSLLISGSFGKYRDHQLHPEVSNLLDNGTKGPTQNERPEKAYLHNARAWGRTS